jgi:hypothetical protein
MKRTQSTINISSAHQLRKYRNLDVNDISSMNLLRDYYTLNSNETLESDSVRQTKLRQEILDRLDSVTELYHTNGHVKSAKVMSEIAWIFETLNNHFIPTVPPSQQEMLEEIQVCLFGTEKYDPLTCYNSTFAIHVVRWGLRYYGLPMVFSSMWKPFAVNYFGLVMAA